MVRRTCSNGVSRNQRQRAGRLSTNHRAAQMLKCSNLRTLGEEALAAFYLKDEMPSLSDLHGGVKEGAVHMLW